VPWGSSAPVLGDHRVCLGYAVCPARAQVVHLAAVAAPLPEASARAGGVFKLELFLPEDYPMAAPKARRAFARLSQAPRRQPRTRRSGGSVRLKWDVRPSVSSRWP